MQVTPDGRITFWNAAAPAPVRVPGRGGVIGACLAMLVPPGEEGEIPPCRTGSAGGNGTEHVEAIRLVKDGWLLDVDVTLWPTRDLDGTTSPALRPLSATSATSSGPSVKQTQLYEQQRHVALTLQKALMGTPPRIPEIETAHRYLPATGGAGVGGDWFDLIPLGAGRAGVFVGDVMGRGLEAAAAMGQLRSAVRLAGQDPAPPAAAHAGAGRVRRRPPASAADHLLLSGHRPRTGMVLPGCR